MAGNETDLSLVIRAIDQATGPMREMRAKIEAALAPINNAGQRINDNLGLKGVGEKWGAFTKAAGGVGHEIGALVSKLAFLGIGAGSAFYAIMHGAVESGDKLSEVSQRLGINADAFAALGHSAQLANIDAESFTSALDKLNKHRGEMKVGKGGPLLEFLNQISPKFAEQVKGAKSNEEALSLYADAFSKIEDPAKRAILATETFGKAGAQMGVWLAQGGAEIQKQQTRFMELMGSQEKFAQGANDLDDALKDTGVAFEGIQRAIAGAFFPVLTELAKKLTAFMASNREGIRAWAEKTAAAVEAWVAGGGLEELGKSLGKVADTVASVVKWLGPMGTAAAAAGVLLAPLAGSVLSFIAAGTSLAVTVAPLIGGAFTALSAVLAPVSAGFAAMGLPLLPLVAALASMAYLGKTIDENWEPLKFIFTDWANSAKWSILNMWDSVKPILEKIAEYTGGEFSAAGALLKVGNSAERGVLSRAAVAAVAPPPVVNSSRPSEARVSVDFRNLPSGARVSRPTGDADVSVNAGYSMVTP